MSINALFFLQNRSLSGSRTIFSHTPAIFICASDKPYSINTAQAPESPFTISPWSISFPLYFWNWGSNSEYFFFPKLDDDNVSRIFSIPWLLLSLHLECSFSGVSKWIYALNCNVLQNWILSLRLCPPWISFL